MCFGVGAYLYWYLAILVWWQVASIFTESWDSSGVFINIPVTPSFPTLLVSGSI